MMLQPYYYGKRNEKNFVNIFFKLTAVSDHDINIGKVYSLIGLHDQVQFPPGRRVQIIDCDQYKL